MPLYFHILQIKSYKNLTFERGKNAQKVLIRLNCFITTYPQSGKCYQFRLMQRMFLSHWLFLLHGPFIFIRDNCQHNSALKENNFWFHACKSIVSSLFSYCLCKCIVLKAFIERISSHSHFSHLLSKLSLCIIKLKKFYIDMTNEMKSPFIWNFTGLVFLNWVAYPVI